MISQEKKALSEECKKPRVTVDFTQRAVQELDALAEELETSKADVIRRALAFLKIAIDQKKEGFNLYFKNEAAELEREVFIV